MFTPAQLDCLRAGYAKIGKIDPALPTYGKLCRRLDGLDDSMLRQVALAGIRFVSSLAANRCLRRGVAL